MKDSDKLKPNDMTAKNYMTTDKIRYQEMQIDDFEQVIQLGTDVHGEGYIDKTNLTEWFDKGVTTQSNANFVAYDGDKLVGFRITFAPNSWQIDHWCSPQLWQVPSNQVCYFKCNTVDQHYRGYGIGSKLLSLSINAITKQGATAGVSHLWMQSPGNSAVKYFTKCGGQLIKEHPDRWNELSQKGYLCPICHNDCHCSAAEMLIRFD
ncbi:GNAT family N-acetyltransferase [Thalassotalea marina]|uniref:GNAT family N-acetyltransferase n=1 Tax=Thalassotalea marina TaxID=1673741 RepID=UPI001E2A9FEF|nr:GNAT family N-acetyltransferase [Thalassotalea marina]